jgi:hypothetical protein
MARYCGLLFSPGTLAGEGIDIQTRYHSGRELQKKLELEPLPKKYHVSKHTLTHTVVIRERALNRAPKERCPHAPIGPPEGADTKYSTYGHLIDGCLEVQADRQLIGRERTDRVIKNKPGYTWIDKTILRTRTESRP